MNDIKKKELRELNKADLSKDGDWEHRVEIYRDMIKGKTKEEREDVINDFRCGGN